MPGYPSGIDTHPEEAYTMNGRIVQADRIAQIVALQEAAAIPAAQASERKWAEARLIWEEHDYDHGNNTFQAISDGIRAAGGKRGSSLGYLSRMERCWRFAVALPGTVFQSLADLGDFNEMYSSPDIQAGRDDRDKRERRAKPARKAEPAPDTSEPATDIHDWAEHIRAYTDSIRAHPSDWPHLSVAEREALAEAGTFLSGLKAPRSAA
jgi:hypothetical protein